MRKIILLTILLITGAMLFAQNQEELINARPLNSISLNLFGDASVISINYERQFLVSPKFILSSKLGLGANAGPSILSSSDVNFTIPHHITGNFGKGRHFFEFGLGGTILFENPSKLYILYAMVGYRILPLRSNKMNFRIFGQLPVLESDDFLFIPFGLNFGISF